MKKESKRRKLFWILGILLLLQVAAAIFFCTKKTGFHYDEYYSYYSSNVTYGLVPTDREWKDGSEIRSEFEVRQGEQFQFSTVVRMQTYDVHPPFYYLLLHAACSMIPGVFSKWPGLVLNLLFFVMSWCLLAALAWHLSREKEAAVIGVCLLYGFNPAVFSGIMLMRMYMLLGLLVLFVTWLHVKALEERKRGWRFYLPLMIGIYLGFLTHYYFAVYLFFLAAAMEVYLLFEKAERKSWGKKWKDCFCYGMGVVGAMLLAVISYPACLGHIFRGYRGTEAMGAFFDGSNTAGRVRFFAGLLNDYVFGSMLPLLMLVIVLLALTVWALSRAEKGGIKSKDPREYGGPEEVGKDAEGYSFAERFRVIWIPAAAAAGYFAVVAKTALLTAEEANRYQLPAYGLILLLSVVVLLRLAQRACAYFKTDKAAKALTGVVVLLLAASEIYGLTQGKVLFLYEEDAENIAFAKENSTVPAVYFYNGDLMWMIWDDSLELMQYDDIYFVNMADLSPISDERLENADRVLVYMMRGVDAQDVLYAVREGMDGNTQVKKLRELLYCDLYEVSCEAQPDSIQ